MMGNCPSLEINKALWYNDATYHKYCKVGRFMTEETITRICYTKEQVDVMIRAAVEEARAIDEASMAKHNREATIISMILGFTTLALFVDGLLRILGIIPPFMHIDVNIIEKITDRVETDVIDKIKQVPYEKIIRVIRR